MHSRIAITLLAAALAGTAAAQGSQRNLGGGCKSNPVALTVSGRLAIGTTMRVDTSYPWTPGGFGILFFGSALPRPVTVNLPHWMTGTVACDVVVFPAAFIDITGSNPGGLTVPIPNDPNLRGLKLGMQMISRLCGFPGCDDALSDGIEVTIG